MSNPCGRNPRNAAIPVQEDQCSLTLIQEFSIEFCGEFVRKALPSLAGIPLRMQQRDGAARVNSAIDAQSPCLAGECAIVWHCWWRAILATAAPSCQYRAAATRTDYARFYFPSSTCRDLQKFHPADSPRHAVQPGRPAPEFVHPQLQTTVPCQGYISLRYRSLVGHTGKSYEKNKAQSPSP